MDVKKIEKLIQLMKKHELQEMEVEDDGKRVRLTAYGAGQVMMSPAVSMGFPTGAPMAGSGLPSNEPGISAVPKDKQICSPFVGTFYSSAGPDSEPFAKVGQKIRKGDTLCIIEAMKIMNEIEAEKDGTIKEILVSNEQAVEFDQAIFIIE